MSRKVYTYSSISNLDSHPKYNEILSGFNITATAEMANILGEEYSKIKSIININEIVKYVVGYWDNENVIFQQYINLSKVMRNIEVEKEKINLYNSFHKNKKAVLDAIRVLIEADLYPEYIEVTNDEEKIFKLIWEKLEEEDSSFGRFRSNMSIYLSDSNLFKRNVLNRCKINNNKIILHGFYFITPIQERVFKILEEAGKELIFLAKIDSRLDVVNEIWYKNFKIENGFESKENWIRSKDLNLNNTGFGMLFEQEANNVVFDNLSIKEYKSEINFIEDIDRIEREEFDLYTGDLSKTEELIKEFYPSRFKRKHLLAYPVGQYIYRLHSMWNADNKRIELTIDDIKDCFLSGWVTKNGVNGMDHMMGLELLKTYVEDCLTIEDWESRLSLLRNIQLHILINFEKHLNDVSSDKKKWHKIAANPLLNLSCFNYSVEDLDELINLINHLVDIAKNLFTGPHEVDLADHLEKVKILLAESSKSSKLEEEEEIILKEIKDRLEYRNFEVEGCLPEEVSEAIMLIIGGGILDEDGFEEQVKKDEENLKALYLAETSVLSNKSKVHLCMGSEYNLPGSRGEYAWPVNRNMLDNMEDKIPKDSMIYYKYMRFIVENSSLANRYLFFSLLENEEVELSWISRDGLEEISPSPYIKILNTICNIDTISVVERNNWSLEEVGKISEDKFNEEYSIDLKDIPISEAKIDLLTCNLRYIYGYILSERPSYKSSFHYNFAISRLIESFLNNGSYSRNEVIEEVLKLFPYLRDVEKQSIKDHVGSKRDEEIEIFDNVGYPKSRLDIHFLTPKTKNEGINLLEEQTEENLKINLDLEGIKDYEICMYCQFNAECLDAQYYKDK